MRTILSLFAVAIWLWLAGVGPRAADVRSGEFGRPESVGERRPWVGMPDDEDEDEDEEDDCPAYPAPVARTGAWTSYRPGDDGDHQAGVSVSPRFTDNLDGSVTDELTGLIWLKDAGCFGMQDWFGSLSSANALASGFCGLTDGSAAGDWRLPNIKELQSLLDYGQYPPLPFDHPFSGVQAAYYWSSTTAVERPEFAWLVYLNHGFIYYDIKINASFYVWPVRGGE